MKQCTSTLPPWAMAESMKSVHDSKCNPRSSLGASFTALTNTQQPGPRLVKMHHRTSAAPVLLLLTLHDLVLVEPGVAYADVAPHRQHVRDARSIQCGAVICRAQTADEQVAQVPHWRGLWHTKTSPLGKAVLWQFENRGERQRRTVGSLLMSLMTMIPLNTFKASVVSEDSSSGTNLLFSKRTHGHEWDLPAAHCSPSEEDEEPGGVRLTHRRSVAVLRPSKFALLLRCWQQALAFQGPQDFEASERESSSTHSILLPEPVIASLVVVRELK